MDLQEFNWNEQKNKFLKNTRQICFEDVILAISENRMLDIVDHNNKNKYPNQQILIVEINNYAYLVPFVVTNDGKIFFKTIIPSRKATKKYLLKSKEEVQHHDRG